MIFHLGQVLEISFVSLFEFFALGLEVELRSVVGQEYDWARFSVVLYVFLADFHEAIAAFVCRLIVVCSDNEQLSFLV